MSELAEKMEADALEAQKFTRKHLVLELDFSLHSIEEIEAHCDDVEFAVQGGKSDENVEMLTRIWGAYVGESLRRARGGEWVLEPSDEGDRIALRDDQQTLYPHQRVRKRLTAGREYSILSYFQEMSEGA